METGLICLAPLLILYISQNENASTQEPNRESRLRYTRWTSRGQWIGQ